MLYYSYSKSRDLKPGKGAGEKIPEESIPEYEELSKIKIGEKCYLISKKVNLH